MRRRGFTLVELLAVIVVLGVIAFISVPITLNLINESRKNSFRNSVNGMIQSVEMYSVKAAGDELYLDLGDEFHLNLLDFSGTKPTAGYVYVDKDGIVSIIMFNNEYCGYRKYAEEGITVLERSSNNCPSSDKEQYEWKNWFLGINS